MARTNSAGRPDDHSGENSSSSSASRRGWSGGSRKQRPSILQDPSRKAEWSRPPLRPVEPATNPEPEQLPPQSRRYSWQQDEPSWPPPSTQAFTPSSSQQQFTVDEKSEAWQSAAGPSLPKKLTVTRVAIWRSRQLTQRGVHTFRRLLHADGADKSGLAALTYAVMLNYATDATMAVALANTLFFSAATGESKGKVALYLLITVAPFALIAPAIGPALDRVQRGRRIALAVSCFGQALLSVVMALHFEDWLLYPAALGTMVLSKSFNVLKAAVTPRVLPPEITLVKTNARLTIFGLAAAGVFGAIAAGFAKLFNSPGALWFTAALCVVGAITCLRIPSWIEVTEGEVPASLRSGSGKRNRQPMGRSVVVALWGNGTIRLLTGFLTLFAAFVIKAQTEHSHSPVQQLLLLGMVGAAAAVGNFVGNGFGARLHFGRPDQVVIACLAITLGATVMAAVLPGIPTVVILALVASVCSALAKISLDATIQNDLPEQSRASAFGRSETILQFGWVFGGAIGVLLPAEYWIGFTVSSVLLAVGLTQTVLCLRGSSLIPGIGGNRPLRAKPVAQTQALPTDRFTEPAWPARESHSGQHPRWPST